MVSQRNSGRRSASGTHAKKRHLRDSRGNLHDMSCQPPPGLKAELDKPFASKHKGYFIQVENKDKKEKKLEYLYTDMKRMAGMEFVPIGNPALTAKCKDISREEGAAIFIVSPAYGNLKDPDELGVHTNRMGYQFRESIVERAREELGISKSVTLNSIVPGAPEPIPDTQAEIDEQADLAIKDLFPRIPNFDRRTIIDRAFNKATLRTGKKPPVGLAPEIPLSRRVQLAVLAHIRHVHTRYDHLLYEHDWAVARQTVRKLCLETLVKWRGDEENGRDQEDALLRELVIISDTESDDDDDDEDSEDEGESSDTSSRRGLSGEDGMEWDSAPSRPAAPQTHQTTAPLSTTEPPADASQVSPTQPPADASPERHRRTIRKAARRAGKRRAKQDRRGFERYLAAQAKWNEAEERLRREASQQPRSPPTVAMNRSASHGSRPWLSTEAGPAPLPVRHVSPSDFRSLDAQVSNRERERLTSGDATQGSLPQIYYRQQGARLERDPLVGELGLIVGSQATHHAGMSVERVRHQDHQDLRDHLVKSIESPELPSFPSQPLGQPSWEQRRDMVTYDRAPAPGMPIGNRPLQHTNNYVAPPRDDLVFLAPRSQANRAMVETGVYPQSTMPVTSQRGFGRIFTAPPATIAHGIHSSGYRENTTTLPSVSSHRPDYRLIAVNDDDAPPRSRARPIMVKETHGQARRVMVDLTRDSPAPPHHQPPVMRSANQTRHPDSEYLVGHGHRTWNEGRQIEQSANDLSQGFVQIIRVSDKFPRRHEAQPAPAETGRYELHSSTPRYRDHQHGFGSAASYEAYPQHAVHHGRVERVVARVEEPLHGYHYQPLPDVMRQPGDIPVNAHRQERVVGLEYVSAAPDRGIHSFASPPRMDTNEGGYWSRPASAVPTFQDQNHRPTPGQHFTREDGVIVLN